MKTSYKIALVAAVAVLALVLVMFAGPSSTDQTTPESTPVAEQPKPEARKSLISESPKTPAPTALADKTPAPANQTPGSSLANDVRSRLRAAGAAQGTAERSASSTPPADKPVNATALTNTDTRPQPEPVEPVTPPAPAVTQNDLDAILGASSTTPPTPIAGADTAARNTAPPRPEPKPAATIGGAYVIQPGDTFSSIASKQYGDESRWFDIAQANPTVDPTRLRVGQELKLPSIESLKEHDEPVPPGPGGIQTYTIRPGDSLSTVAEQFYGDPTLWRVIYNFNRDKIGENPNAIQAGMSLKVPPRVSGAS